MATLNARTWTKQNNTHTNKWIKQKTFPERDDLPSLFDPITDQARKEGSFSMDLLRSATLAHYTQVLFLFFN